MPAEHAAAALALQPFFGAPLGDWFVARTGYTGEDGFELMLPAEAAAPLWRELNEQGVVSCGLGARDTLRLEAGMNLYGNDMDETTQPLECGLAWTVAFEPVDRAFIGRAALEGARAAGGGRKQVGLVLAERAVMRAHQKVYTSAGEGEITSGGFSPTIGVSIALARLPAAAAVPGTTVEVDVRGKRLAAQVVRPPFVRNGKSLLKN
jgi:aminomethyltransferase